MIEQLPFEQLRWLTCPTCGENAAVLGQYSPLYPVYVCKTCSLENPYPAHVFIEDPKNKKLGIKVNPNADSAERELRMWRDELMRQVNRRILDERDVTKYNFTGLQLYNGIRRSKHAQYAAWSKQTRIRLTYRQIGFPVCDRCGSIHDRFSPDLGDYRQYCQACDDKNSVEALYRNKGIFGGDDVETILDRLHNAFKELFDRGVLPDYWYELIRQD